MQVTHDGSHGDDCYGCRIKSIQLSPAATPTRHNRVAPRKPDPAWERGRAGERRVDGSFMPYLHGDGTPVGVKHMQDRRGHLEAARKAQLESPVPLT